MTEFALPPVLQLALAYYCCVSPTVTGTVVFDLDSAILADPIAAKVTEAVKKIHSSRKRFPQSIEEVMGFFSEQQHRGALSVGDVEAIGAFLSLAKDQWTSGNLLPVDALIEACRPFVERRLTYAATTSAMSLPSVPAEKRAEFAQGLVRQLNRINDFGRIDLTTAQGITEEDLEQFRLSISEEDLLRTGHPELDLLLAHGFRRGETNTIIAPPGEGKSKFMTGMAAEAFARGFRVAYFGSEGNLLDLKLETLAAITRTPTETLRFYSKQQWARLFEEYRIDPVLFSSEMRYKIYQSPPSARQVIDDIDRIEDTDKRPLDVILIDHTTNMRDTQAASSWNTDSDRVTSLAAAYDRIQSYTQTTKRFTFTAHHANPIVTSGPRSNGERYITTPKWARDLLNPVHIALSINPVTDKEIPNPKQHVTVYCIKARGRKTTGWHVTVPKGFAIGRLAGDAVFDDGQQQF